MGSNPKAMDHNELLASEPFLECIKLSGIAIRRMSSASNFQELCLTIR